MLAEAALTANNSAKIVLSQVGLGQALVIYPAAIFADSPARKTSYS